MVTLRRNKSTTTSSSPSTVSAWAAILIGLVMACMGYMIGTQLNWDCVPEIVTTMDTTQQQQQHDVSTSSFQLAQDESLGFFRDIPEREWIMLKERVKQVQPNVCPYCRGGANTHAWFQNNYEPDFNCRHERRIGRLGDGGKWVCDPHLITESPSCLVYSVGSNGEFSFEDAVKRDIGSHCEVHTFDMRNYSEQALKVGAIYHQFGIGAKEGRDRRGFYYKTLSQTVQELGHEGRTIDIFKIDCDGCEWNTFASLFDSSVDMRQVLIELHSGRDNKMPEPQSYDFFRNMYKQGFVIFHKEANIHYWRYTGAVEYAFLRLNQTFFQDIIP